MQDIRAEDFGLAPVKAEGAASKYDRGAELLVKQSIFREVMETRVWMELPVQPYAPDARAAIHAAVDKWLDDLYAGRNGA